MSDSEDVFASNEDIEERHLEMRRPRFRPRVIVIVTYHFLPSPEVGAKRMTALAQYLANRGDEVVIVSAFESLETLAADDGRLGILNLFRLEAVPLRSKIFTEIAVRTKRLLSRASARAFGPAGRRAVIHSAADGIAGHSTARAFRAGIFSVLHAVDDKKRWALDAYRKVMKLSGSLRPDLLIVSAPPMSSLCGATFASKRLRVPLVVDLRDPILGIDNDGRRCLMLDRIARRLLEKYIVQHGRYIVTTSPGLRDFLRKTYSIPETTVVSIPNGFDISPAAPRAVTANELVIVYAGALYLNRNPFPLLEAVDDLIHSPDVEASKLRVIFAGDCDHYAGTPLREWVSTRPCGQVVTIMGRLTDGELKELYDSATLLVNFAEGQPMQVPAKTFELLALGRELLVLCEPESDTARLVTGLPGVFMARSSDASRLRILLRDFYQRHALDGTMSGIDPRLITGYSRGARNLDFATLIDTVAHSDSTPRRPRLSG